MAKRVLFVLIVILAFTTPVFAEDTPPNGVDDLRGRWDVVLFLGEELEKVIDVRWFIQDIEPNPEQENQFLASGCMLTKSSRKRAPLSLVATYLPENNSYEILVYSTSLPDDGEPFVVRFDGEIIVNGSGVKDDKGEGEHISDNGKGPWESSHHDRRRPSCKGDVDSGLQFDADVYAHKDHGPLPPQYSKLYETYTKIVSSGMIVEAPDGEVIMVEPYTDLFSPHVDFVSEFRYLSSFEGAPISGEFYKFTLLDILGNPIPGAYVEDIWMGCTQDAPENVVLSDTIEGDIHISWDPVFVADGWDPGGDPQVGYYQIGISPTFESSTGFGSAGISSTYHIIPWEDFIPGEPGDPDGGDFGVSLSELEDGDYEVGVEAFAEAPSWSGGVGAECAVRDSSQFFQMHKDDGDLTFNKVGLLLGHVQNDIGDPLQGIWVDACEYSDEPQYCQSQLTDENGDYRIIGLLPGDYRVQAGSESYATEYYDETYNWELATPVEMYPGGVTSGIDFMLALGGSISGTVYDEYDEPLSNIAVDIDVGGYGTCTDEEGNYSMQGMPIGIYDVVAGRDFCDPHDYKEETIEGVELTSLLPDVTGVDFYLPLGGSVSGVVKDDANNPLEGIQVVACVYDYDGYCMDAFSEDDGTYLITGLPPEGYRVWAGSESHVMEFYEETFDWNLATRVSVAGGVTVTEINFSLEEGGSISGVVEDDDENPLGGIQVVACEYDGGYCMDAYSEGDGTFLITGLPASEYRVQADDESYYLEFYEETDDGELATRVEVVVGGITIDINFSLLSIE